MGYEDLFRILFGQAGGQEKLGTQTPEQQQLLQQLIQGMSGAQGQGLDWIKQILGGDTSAFEAPLLRQYNEETVPGIANQFAGMGSHGSFGGSGFQQALGSAGGQLTENLAAMRAGLKNQAIGQLQNFASQAYQPTFQNAYRPPTGGVLGGLAGGLAGGLGSLIGTSALSKIAGGA